MYTSVWTPTNLCSRARLSRLTHTTPLSPIKHLTLAQQSNSRDEQSDTSGNRHQNYSPHLPPKSQQRGCKVLTFTTPSPSSGGHEMSIDIPICRIEACDVWPLNLTSVDSQLPKKDRPLRAAGGEKTTTFRYCTIFLKKSIAPPEIRSRDRESTPCSPTPS